MKDEKILFLTKKDIGQEIRNKFTKKQIKKSTYFAVSKVIKRDGDNYVDYFIDAINRYKETAAKKFNVAGNKIKISYNVSWSTFSLVFFAYREETDKEFEKRIQKKIFDSWIKCEKKQKNIAEKIKIKKAREKRNNIIKQRNAIKAIEEFGGDIYKVFQEINKKR